MTVETKESSASLKVKSTFSQDIIHGTVVSYQAEGRITGGEYGILDVAGAKPIMLWPGLNASFGVDVITTPVNVYET
jgi:hypothetical protein